MNSEFLDRPDDSYDAMLKEQELIRNLEAAIDSKIKEVITSQRQMPFRACQYYPRPRWCSSCTSIPRSLQMSESRIKQITRIARLASA
jgi:hypothetical protein